MKIQSCLVFSQVQNPSRGQEREGYSIVEDAHGGRGHKCPQAATSSLTAGKMRPQMQEFATPPPLGTRSTQSDRETANSIFIAIPVLEP